MMNLISVLDCEEDNVSMDEEDIKHASNTLDSKNATENESSDFDHDSGVTETKIIKNAAIKESHNDESLKVKSNRPYNDDIRIIDLESRGEGSVSSYGRSTSDSPHQGFSSAVENGMASNSASYTDQDRETSSPQSNNSSTCSATESPPR